MIKYKIRRKVLNMTIDEWDKLNKLHPGDVFETTPSDFLIHIGLPGGLGSYFNSDERKFFDEIYDLKRRLDHRPQDKDYTCENSKLSAAAT